jgi:hypothetical protein
METEAARKVREGTEVSEHGTICLNNGAAIEHLRVLSAITELSLKINTGMQMTRTPMVSFCASQYGTKGKTYKKVLREMVDYYETTYGRKMDRDTVLRALGK